jgi:2-dehydropantoate 2-reductase
MKICIYGATQILTPALDVVLALVAQRAKIAGLYGMSPPVKAKSPVFA